MKCLVSLFLTICLFSCSHPNEGQTFDFDNVIGNTHFFIDRIADKTYILTVRKPFVGSKKVEKYCLYPSAELPPDIDGITHFIPTPIDKVVITSTTHLGFLEAINLGNVIVGASNLSLFYSPAFQKKVNSGDIRSVGKAKLNQEQLIQLNADVIFSYAIDAGGMKEVAQLRKLGQKVIVIAEYMEQEPLSKAEWIKFFASFFSERAIHQADSHYLAVSSRYHKLEELTKSVNNKPSVMIGYPWKGNWYVSGGSSFQAAYFKSANVNYIWSDLKQEASVPLATETVINDALEAEYWVNCGNKQQLNAIVEGDDRFEAFNAFQKRKVYNNYKRSNALGANDYWESGVVRPDLILSDLIKIMHPKLLQEHNLVYYNQLD